MNSIILVLLIAVIPQLPSSYTHAIPKPEQDLRIHMRIMYDLKDRIFAGLDADEPLKTAKFIEELRFQAIEAMKLQPRKIANLSEPENRKAFLLYQREMARLILVTLSLEETVLEIPLNELEKRQKDDKLRTLTSQLLKIVGQGHQTFR